ncbi:hypothetical protein [Brevibacillus dissolubilis]|uniref:hypothetical protein n=1 Tax=Brevibacillus dissolubilis TaxID=1844116 RepID=UPI001116B414|nr:hypothetical protein [Brevibacillus dissolubilis]
MRVQAGYEMLSASTISHIKQEQDNRLTDDSWRDLNVCGRLVDEAFLSALWAGLRDVEKEAARLFILESSHGFYRKKEWDQLTADKAHLAWGLTGLRRLGLVLTVRKMWSEVGYMMPLEVRHALGQQIMSQQQDSSEPDVISIGSFQTLSYDVISGRGIHLDIVALLLFVRDQEMKLTQKNQLHRRMIQRIMPLISMLDEHVGHLYTERFPAEVRQAYPASLAVLLDIVFRMRLLYIQDKRLALSESIVDQWLSMQKVERWERIMQLLISDYLPKEAWIEAFVSEMRRISHSEWIAVEASLQQLRVKGYTIPSDAQEQLRNWWLHPLLGFGCVELGEHPEAGLCWRWNPTVIYAEVEQGQWYVEPTGTVIIPPTVPLTRMWQIGRLGELNFDGDMVRCVLTSGQVQTYIGNGGSEEQILSFLQENCPYPLPESITELVEKWGQNARQIRFQTLVRVRTANPRLLDELKQLPMLQTFLTEVISDTDFLIPCEQEADLMERLRQCGYEPQAGKIERFTPLVESLQADRESSADGDAVTALAEHEIEAETETTGLFQAENPWTGYRIENVFPDQYDSMPQLAMLPKMWTSHYQSYHPQTLRDLFRRARELKLTTQLELRSGQEYKGTTHNIEVEMGYWIVTLETEQRKRHKVKLDEIGRVRLLLPNYV